MLPILRTIVLRLALCGCVTALAWRWGVGARLGTLPLYGLTLARPLIDLASELRHQFRRLHWRKLEGRHYNFRRQLIDVQVDDDHVRWVRIADVRAAVGITTTDGALRLSYSGALRAFGRPPQAYLRADALVRHLAKERGAAVLRFRRWVEREIAFPARRERERLGLVDASFRETEPQA